MDRQTLRDWAHRFNQHGPDGLIDIKPSEATAAAVGRAEADIEATRRGRTRPGDGLGRALALSI